MLFYFGENRTRLEREIEQVYLSAKQYKFRRAEKEKEMGKQFIEEVKWTERDQRILEEKINWQPTNPTLTDLNFRTYFEPLEYPKRVDYFLKFEKLDREWGWFEDWKFRYFTARFYDPKKSEYYDWVQEKLLIRIMNHLRSTEFTSILNIPHDYMIQAQIVQVHFWIVMNRLKRIGTREALILARRMEITLEMEIVRSSQSVNLKKSNVLTSTLERMLTMNSNIL